MARRLLGLALTSHHVFHTRENKLLRAQAGREQDKDHIGVMADESDEVLR